MADLETLQQQVAELRDLEEIKKVKYRYFRAMTNHDYDLLKETLTEDVETSYSDGEYVFADREKLLTFLIDSHDPDAQIIAYWMAGMPEIELEGATTASATWAMYHYFFNQKHGSVDEMFVYYSDTYRKEDGAWRISKAGYTRVITQILDRREMPYKMKAPPWAVASGGPGSD